MWMDCTSFWLKLLCVNSCKDPVGVLIFHVRMWKKYRMFSNGESSYRAACCCEWGKGSHSCIRFKLWNCFFLIMLKCNLSSHCFNALHWAGLSEHNTEQMYLFAVASFWQLLRAEWHWKFIDRIFFLVSGRFSVYLSS